jgi:hypothetical protein
MANSFPDLQALGSAISCLAEDHLDFVFRRCLAGSLLTNDGGSFRFVSGEPHPFGNFLFLERGLSHSEIPRLVEPLLQCHAPSAVLAPGTARQEIAECLAACGFDPVGAMPAMAVAIDRLPETPLPPGYQFGRIVTAVDAAAWTAAFAEGYEIPPGLSRHFSPETVAHESGSAAALQYFGIQHKGRLVATSCMFLHGGVAGIYSVATIPSERGRGLGATMTAEPLRSVQSLGYRVAVLQSSPMGFPLYRRLGFAAHGSINMYVRIPKS